MDSRPVALVTGATRGIGRRVAELLAPSHHLLLGGRDLEALHQFARSLPDARPWPVELTDSAALAAATSGISRLDVLVHSAGVSSLGTVAETNVATWRRTMEVNVIAVAELTRLLLPALRSAEGHVILINSGAGLRVNPGWTAYAASKFALRAFADGLRGEEPSLRVTSVHPGRTATDMQRGVREAEGGAYEPDKYLQPQSVAGAVFMAITAPRDAHLTDLVVRPDTRL
ncbi:SDR family oxidoreductase [Allokutzneria sp. NRRL B-24872]|uniref:SDR family oxidoreductase n=1 Tax=Allokutzneria sp. NRRL B-24872 TaxID=1137961 RepID=UPI000A3D353C|nr:SDR family oxidoreductase [Allokutzneria sp. NRRL B-24872]